MNYAYDHSKIPLELIGQKLPDISHFVKQTEEYYAQIKLHDIMKRMKEDKTDYMAISSYGKLNYAGDDIAKQTESFLFQTKHNKYIENMIRIIETNQYDDAIDLFIQPKEYDNEYDASIRVTGATCSSNQKLVLKYYLPAFVPSNQETLSKEPLQLVVFGVGGSGKTTVVRLLELLCRDFSKKVGLSAMTGSAAALLPNGKTTFKQVLCVYVVCVCVCVCVC